MKIIKITNSTPDSFRIRLIKFISKYGDGHITLKAINWFKKTNFFSLNLDNGDLIYVSLNNNEKICGVLVISNYGLKQAFIVVHPLIRKKGLANSLTSEALKSLNRLYVKVANDNVPSLKHCFSLGMRAFDMIIGPTGKPTFVFGYGDFDPEEWHKYNSIK